MSDANLNDLERRLAGWRPATDALDADAMLFAAGRASIRRSPMRFAWPAIAACLAVAVGILGTQLSAERHEYQNLLARMEAIEPSVAVVVQPLPESSYLIARRSWERDPDCEFQRQEIHPSANQSHPVLRAGERNVEIP